MAAAKVRRMPKVLLAFIIAFVVCQIALLCTTVYLHRCLAHKAISLSPPARAVFRVLIWLMTGIRPRQWAAVHRKHHAYTDVPGDPHSPLIEGFWKVQLGNAALYRKVARDSEAVRRYTRDLPPDKWDRLLFDHALIGLSLGILLLYLIFGWQVALMAAGMHVVMYLLINAAVNAVGHRFGKKVYDNLATNNLWLALLAGGEGWHNNHHAAPTSARLGLAKGEVDPGFWVVRLLVRLGQAKIRLSELKLTPRSSPPLEAVGG